MSEIRFLIADTSPAVQAFCRQLLEGYGFDRSRIDTASNPEAALDIAANRPPHLLLTDCFSKSAVNAFTLHQNVLAHNPTCRLALMSAHLTQDLLAQAQQAHTLFELAKPFTAPGIKAALGKAMEQLAKTHPQIAHKLQSAMVTSIATSPRPALPVLPKYQAGDRVLYDGQRETIKHVIFRQGELVVQLLGKPGTVPATKLARQ